MHMGFFAPKKFKNQFLYPKDKDSEFLCMDKFYLRKKLSLKMQQNRFFFLTPKEPTFLKSVLSFFMYSTR